MLKRCFIVVDLHRQRKCPFVLHLQHVTEASDLCLLLTLDLLELGNFFFESRIFLTHRSVLFYVLLQKFGFLVKLKLLCFECTLECLDLVLQDVQFLLDLHFGWLALLVLFELLDARIESFFLVFQVLYLFFNGLNKSAKRLLLDLVILLDQKLLFQSGHSLRQTETDLFLAFFETVELLEDIFALAFPALLILDKVLFDLAVDRVPYLLHPLSQFVRVQLVLAEHVQLDLYLGQYFIGQNTLLVPVDLDYLVQLSIAFLKLIALLSQLHVHLASLRQPLFEYLALQRLLVDLGSNLLQAVDLVLEILNLDCLLRLDVYFLRDLDSLLSPSLQPCLHNLIELIRGRFLLLRLLGRSLVFNLGLLRL